MATYAKLLMNGNDTILPYTRDSLVYTASNVPLSDVNVLCDNSESVPTTTSETVKTNEELTQIVTSGTVNKATTATSATTASGLFSYGTGNGIYFAWKDGHVVCKVDVTEGVSMQYAEWASHFSGMSVSNGTLTITN